MKRKLVRVIRHRMATRSITVKRLYSLTKCLTGVIKPYGFDNPTRSLGALVCQPYFVVHSTSYSNFLMIMLFNFRLSL